MRSYLFVSVGLLCLAVFVFFFFFQAEDGIRDSLCDWSSDVCSSDLADVRAGLIVMGKQHAALCIERQGNRLKIVLRVNNDPKQSLLLASALIGLRMSMRDGGLCTFS